MKRVVVVGLVFLGTAASLVQGRAQSTSGSCVPLARVAVNVDGYGGRIVRYAGGLGTAIDVRVPPAGYDPRRAGDRENVWYGIPARPARRASLAVWERGWGSARTFDDRAPCVANTTRRPTSRKASCQAADRCSLNWSGVYDDAPSNAASTGMSATVRMPDDEATCDGPSDHASWVGIGGIHGNALLQNGVDTAYNGSLNTPYLFWAASGPRGEYYEYDYPPSTYGEPSMGDSVALATSFDRSRGLVTFSFRDLSGSHDVINATPSSIGGHSDTYFYDASSAEAIDERPYGDNSLFLMPDFGSSPVAWTDVRSFSTSESHGRAVRDGPGASVAMMEGDSGQVLVSPTTIPGHDSADSFQNNWSACGDTDLD